MSNNNQPQYKRGTIIKNGKRYGFYPDGSLYRIYSTSDRPFLEIVDIEGKIFLRIRQATEQGYTDCPAPGAADLSYPTSALRRSRTVGGERPRTSAYNSELLQSESLAEVSCPVSSKVGPFLGRLNSHISKDAYKLKVEELKTDVLGRAGGVEPS